MMGLKYSPYLTTQRMGCAEEFIWGDYRHYDKPFQCRNIRLNIPEDSKYSPSLPWVSNITKEGNLSADFWTYIDNIRSIASSE